MHVDHPHDERFDTVTVECEPRWKESGLSGDEYRFSYIVRFFRKGELIIQRSYSRLEWALEAMRPGYPADEKSFDHEAWDRTKDKCDQPSCAKEASVFYERLKPYTKQGQELVKRADFLEYRQFCEDHTTRGDCALDDADHNYRPIADPR